MSNLSWKIIAFLCLIPPSVTFGVWISNLDGEERIDLGLIMTAFPALSLWALGQVKKS